MDLKLIYRNDKFKLSKYKFYIFSNYTKISFQGCKGNDNRFATAESCFNTCGGQEPETISTCKGITCDHSMANMMKAKGCQPLIQPGNITLDSEFINPSTSGPLPVLLMVI